MNVDYNLFERMHKQDGGTPDQQRHYEYGWEACECAYTSEPICRLTESLEELLEDIDLALRISLSEAEHDNYCEGPWLPNGQWTRLKEHLKSLREFNEFRTAKDINGRST